MRYVRRCIREMTGYVPGEPTDDPSVIKLNQNENRYPPSPKVIEAIDAAKASLASYPESSSAGIRRAAAAVYGVDESEVMATNGSDEMLRILFQACCDPGDEAVAFYPSYTYYSTLAAMQDVRYRLIDFAGEFHLPEHLDIDAAKLVFLPNPNAPTGTVFPEADIRRLAEASTGGLVVVDEAYADFSGQTAIPLIREYDNLVVVRTFSKSYGLAGLRLGLGFGRADLFCQFEKVRDYFNLDRLAQAGGEAAIRDQEWLRTTCARVNATRDRVIGALRGMGLKTYDSGANFVMVRFESAARARAVFTGLRERGVLVRYFSARAVDDCLRVSIGTDADMDAFLERLNHVLAAIKEA